MKLKKWVKGVLVVCLFISIGLVVMTIESDFTSDYLAFIVSNLFVIFGTSYLLIKFGGV